MTTQRLDLLSIRQRLGTFEKPIRREDLAFHTRLCYTTICRCESQYTWPTQFARRVILMEVLRELLINAGESAESVKKTYGIPDLMPTLKAEIDHVDEVENQSRREKANARRAEDHPDQQRLFGEEDAMAIPGRGAGFFAS